MGYNINGTRPTMDRVKESMFAMIQSNIKNSICLDLFAGSGSLGIEALSNGARWCYFVENSSEIYGILKNNLSFISDYTLLNLDYKDALSRFSNEGLKFDLIFLDPPYSLNLINGVLDYIYSNDLLSDNGMIVCEFESENVFSNCFELYKTRKYGSKFVSIYKK